MFKYKINDDLVFNKTENNTIFINIEKNTQIKIKGYLNSIFTQKLYQRLINDNNELTLDQEEIEAIKFLEEKNILICLSNKKKEKILSEKPKLSSLTIFTTDQCNLNCIYCFEKTNNAVNSKKMDLNTLRDTLYYFLKNFNYDKKIYISFFGGEPLLNFDLIKKSIDLFKKIEKEYDIKFYYGITTNGTILNEEIKQFLIAYKFSITISIDGYKNIHDKQRPFITGKGSYTSIINNVKLLSKYLSINARLTILCNKINLVKVYNELINYGFSNLTLDLVSEKKSINKNEFDLLIKELNNVSDYIYQNLKKGKIINITNFINVLMGLADKNKKQNYYPCGTLNSGYAVNTSGEIYLCHRFNNMNNFSFGNIYTDFDFDKRKNFLKKHNQLLRNSLECSTCIYNIYCEGSCYHTAYCANGSTEKVSEYHCLFKKTIIDNSIKIFSNLSEDEKNILIKKP